MSGAAKNHLWEAEEYHCYSSVQDDAATQLLQHIQFNGYEHVLDIGCGDGKITAKIATRVPTGSVIGIDASPEMINFAGKSFSKDHHKNLTFLTQDAQQINYCEDFDILFSSFALQWIEDLGSFFKGVHKSLKASGYIAATVPLNISLPLEEAIRTIIALPEWSSYFRAFSPGWHFVPASKIEQLLKDNQLSITYFTTVLQSVIFLSREHFEKYVVQWFSYLQILPHHFKQTFFKQIIDRYLEINPCLENGKITFSFNRLDFIAKKAMF